MKKLIGLFTFSLMILALNYTSASAQASSASAMTVTSASYANTGADTATIKATGAYTVVSIQPVITKISGTVAGTAVLYGSLDGINYVAAGTDTLTLANITTNTTIWHVTPSKYLYYRVRVVGSGTMGASFKSWFLGKQ